MATDCYLSIEMGRTEAFEQKLQQMLRQGGYCLLLSIGHRTGLFEVMSRLELATSREIAEQSGLQEHYVQDWLTAMVEGELVEYDEMFKTYRLPAENAALLTRSTGFKNYASSVRWFTIFGRLEDEIVDCFRDGNGVPQSVFSELQSKLAVENWETEINGLFKNVLPLVPSLIMRLCEGLQVLDLGCGNGSTLLELAQTFPKSQFVGYDACPASIREARTAALTRGIENVTFYESNLEEIRLIESFDLITAFDIMPAQAYPFQVLDEVYSALKPGGVFLMQDLAAIQKADTGQQKQITPFLRTISCLRRMAQQNHQEAGFTCWGDVPAERVLEEIGFESVEVHELPHDMLNAYYVATKPAGNAE